MILLYWLISLSFAQTQPIPLPSPSPSSSATPLKELKDIKAKIELIEGNALIEWNPKEAEIKLLESAPQPGFTVHLSGKVRDAKLSYISEKPSKPLPATADGQTSIDLPLDKEFTDVSLLEINSSGKIDTAKYRVTISDWLSADAILKSNIQIKPWAFAFGLGFTSINFSQTNTDFASLNLISTTIKTTVDRKLGTKGFVAGFSGFFNILPLSGTATGSNAFRFLGLNLKIGKTLKTLPEPWELAVHVGYYYLTMITNGTLGFNNVSGPELYPTVSRKFKNGSQAILYLKFSPISQSFSLLSLSNNEIAIGATYRFAKKTKIQWLAGLDFASVNFSTIDTTSQLSAIQTSNITLWGGVGF